VIENLFRNAIDAIETSGALEVRFGEKGKYAYIDVIDTGKGIPKSKLEILYNSLQINHNCIIYMQYLQFQFT
jgi:signal transduction histidine kinase